jgi:GxxExxY protein
VRYPEITEKIAAALKVHSAIGPGVLESVYKTCLAHELKQSGVTALTEVALPVVHNGLRLDSGFRIDLLVEDLVVVELKMRGYFVADSQSAVINVFVALQ